MLVSAAPPPCQAHALWRFAGQLSGRRMNPNELAACMREWLLIGFAACIAQAFPTDVFSARHAVHRHHLAETQAVLCFLSDNMLDELLTLSSTSDLHRCWPAGVLSYLSSRAVSSSDASFLASARRSNKLLVPTAGSQLLPASVVVHMGGAGGSMTAARLLGRTDPKQLVLAHPQLPEHVCRSVGSAISCWLPHSMTTEATAHVRAWRDRFSC